jgi:predicted dehydrogenase
MRILIVGLGGIGQRHVRNLRGLYGSQCEILAYRVRGQQRVLTDTLEVGSESGLAEHYGIQSFDSLEEALALHPDAAIICNPSGLHVPVAIAVAKAGCHLLIEKPISDSVEGLDELSSIVESNELTCMVAYQLRFHPCLQLAHRLLANGAIGRPVAARATVGEYLPGWHRYEDYRAMYASRRELGGGVVLSQIHELDLLYWFFGRPERIFSHGGHFSDLEIDVEDVASSVFAYKNMVAHLHQDYLQQPPSRQFEIIGSKGKIVVDLRGLSVAAFDGTGQSIAHQSFEGLERNSLFLEEMKSFIGAVQCKSSVPVDLKAGRQSLEMALAIRRSIQHQTVIDMGTV